MQGFAEYVEYDGLGLAQLIHARQVSAGEVLEAAIARIEQLNPHLNAVVTKVYDQARGEAAALDRDAPFAGVPFLLKDLGGALAGVPLTGGSRFFANAPAPADAEIVTRHKRAGLMILGRTNTPEFGLSATTEPVLFGPTRNPWDLTRTAGGSSGGSAAAVAARMVPLAHASDGGGSIRIPASCCGLFGMKTTRSRNTMAPYAGESLAGCSVEHVVSRSVRDSAAALDATAGPAPGDPYYAPPPARPFLDEVGTSPGCLRIAARHPGIRRRAGAPGLRRGCRSQRQAVRGTRPCGRGGIARLRRRRAGHQLQPHLRGRRRGQHPAARPGARQRAGPGRLRAGDLGHDRAGPADRRARLRHDDQPTARASAAKSPGSSRPTTCCSRQPWPSRRSSSACST